MAQEKHHKGLAHIGKRVLAIDAADDLESLIWKDDKGQTKELTYSHNLQKMIAKYNIKTVQLLRLNAILFFVIAAMLTILVAESTYVLYTINKWDVISRFLASLAV